MVNVEGGTALAIRSSETQVLTRATLSNIPEDDILRSHIREDLVLAGWAL
jgi:hypothetical protein